MKQLKVEKLELLGVFLSMKELLQTSTSNYFLV